MNVANSDIVAMHSDSSKQTAKASGGIDVQKLANTVQHGAALRTIFAAVVCLSALVSGAVAKQPDNDRIKLKLFKKSDVDRSEGCSVVLWQSNRDPDNDKYAYVFVEKLNLDHVRQPARIRVAGKTIRLRRVATGGTKMGYDLYTYQLYKMSGRQGYVIIDAKLEEFGGETVDIDSGTMSVIMGGKRVFRSSIKGNAGCATPAAPATDDKASYSDPEVSDSMFYRYAVPFRQVPRAVRNAARKRYGCNTDAMRAGVTGVQLSEESAIWEIPCRRYAYQSTSAFALVYLPDPAQNLTFLTFEFPRGHKRGSGTGLLTSPKWNVKSRTISSTALGRAQGDCGVFERHRVTAAGEFRLTEFRAKPRCDGRQVAPWKFPLVFRGR